MAYLLVDNFIANDENVASYRLRHQLLRITHLNWDYDRVHEQANGHSFIRQMLGHSSIFDKYYYELQTIKDNVRLLTPEILDEINQVVIKTGHALLKKKIRR